MPHKHYIVPQQEIRRFIESLAEVTGTMITFLSRDEDRRSVSAGVGPFCLSVRGTSMGDNRCRESIGELLDRSQPDDGTLFTLCHARMGQVLCPIHINGRHLGHVVICQAVVEGISEEHRDHLRSLAEKLGMESPQSLVALAEKSPVFSRSALEGLGRFIQEQMAEKVLAKTSLEETTQFLMDKYEELMFLYSITENLAPDREYRNSLSVIVDRGLQKLSADSGFFVLPGAEGTLSQDSFEIHGEVSGDHHTAGLVEISEDLAGPACVLPDPVGYEGDGSRRAGLIFPFRIRNYSRGHLVFFWENMENVGDSEVKFAEALANQASSLLHGAYMYKELADLLFNTLEALSSAVDAKDPYTRGHSQRVAEYALMIAAVMGYDSKFLTMLKVAGMLHDFGKIGVSEKILAKEGRLSDEEREAINDHPVIGSRILGKFRSFSEIVPGIRHHHERFDGGGYPDGLTGERIPLVGRIISVADAFDAMTTTRPYREKMSLEEASQELRRNSGTQFDPELVESFLASLESRNSHDD